MLINMIYWGLLTLGTVTAIGLVFALCVCVLFKVMTND